MALDVNCTRRDYLYGRLLAVADRIEYRTFDKDDGRQTNAKRYMNAFSSESIPDLEDTGGKAGALSGPADAAGTAGISKPDRQYLQ